jgi:hypothetical protein
VRLETKQDRIRDVLLVFKMAFDRIQDVELQLFFDIALSENGMTESMPLIVTVFAGDDDDFNFLVMEHFLERFDEILVKLACF